MVAILKRQQFNDAHPGGPAGGHRRGAQDRHDHEDPHDAAIVYGPKPYVLVVLVRGIQDQKISAALIASISREVWTAVNAPGSAER